MTRIDEIVQKHMKLYAQNREESIDDTLRAALMECVEECAKTCQPYIKESQLGISEGHIQAECQKCQTALHIQAAIRALAQEGK